MLRLVVMQLMQPMPKALKQAPLALLQMEMPLR